MLASAGLGDQSPLAQTLREKSLTEHIVDLVRAGVVEVLALEDDARATAVRGEPGHLGDDARTARVRGVQARELGLVNRVIASEDLERETVAWAKRVADQPHGALRMAKLAINKVQDLQGFSSSMEGAFADFLVLAQMGGHPRKPAANRRLGGVDLALRGARGERES